MKLPDLKVAVAHKPAIQPLHLLFLIISTLMLLLCVTTAFADDTSSGGSANPNQNPAYMWKDSQGVTTYGDQPDNPSTQQYNINATQPATQPNATQTTKTPTTTTDTTTDKTVPKDDTAASKSALQEQQDQIDANCKKAQDNVTLLQNTSHRIYVTDPNGGTPHYLTEEERQSQLELAQKQASVYCDENGGATAGGK